MREGAGRVASIGRVEAELSKAQDGPMDRPQQSEKSVKGKRGDVRITTNFDCQVKQAANWLDAKMYDAKRYEAGINRMAIWAMPLGQMVLGKGLKSGGLAA